MFANILNIVITFTNLKNLKGAFVFGLGEGGLVGCSILAECVPTFAKPVLLNK